jgi:NADPH:quinone reductase-like Zn-dependent oxidoreductase
MPDLVRLFSQASIVLATSKQWSKRMNLKEEKVVVTGGSRGLGLGLVEALVAHGAKVTVVARDADRLGRSAPGSASPRSPPT